MATKKNDETMPETPDAAAIAAQSAADEGTDGEYESVRVKISKKVFDNTGGEGAYYDPETKKTIGAKAVTVPATEFVEALLRNQELSKA